MLLRRFILVSTATLAIGLFAVADAVRGEDKLWQTDFTAAKAKAKAENKLLLVDFTGSDWCGFCKQLVAEVFSKEAFKTEAPKKFVLVELDYPTPAKKKKQSAELQKQNETLAKQYKIHGYPTILVMDAKGNVVAKSIGYAGGGAEKYVEQLTNFVEIHEDVLKKTKELADARGLDRAKLLDKLIDDYKALNNEIADIPAWDKEIVKLDADNKAGLKVKHEFRIFMADANSLRERQQLPEAKEAIDKALALTGITGEQKHDAYMAKTECCFDQGDFVGVVASLTSGIEAAPDNKQAKQFKEIIERFKPMADAQEAIGKLKAKLPNVKGLDRAKTLDKLIEAWQKLGGRSRDVSGQQIEKWSREIPTLDADNKAGLKLKYEFRIQMANAATVRGRLPDYRTAVEKILAMHGLTSDQIQSGRFALAYAYLNANDLKNGLEQLKKAYDAAPDTPLAARIKSAIGETKQRMEKETSKKK